MRKVYKKLKKEQRARGIVFSSTLSTATTEQPEDEINEVKADDPKREEKIRRLKDDRWFRESPWTYNIIRS